MIQSPVATAKNTVARTPPLFENAATILFGTIPTKTIKGLLPDFPETTFTEDLMSILNAPVDFTVIPTTPATIRATIDDAKKNPKVL